MTRNLPALIGWMAGTLVSFSALAVSIRELQGALSVFEMLALRNAAGVAILLGLALGRPDLRATLRPRRMRLQVFRNVVHFAGTYAWALGVTLLPLALVFALEFTTPIWVAGLAVLVLRERLTPTRLAAIILGFVGVLVIGFQRAAFSNEAGVGSAPIAHSAVKTKHPVSEGFVAMLEPFIDTVIICTMTALTIVIADTTFYNDAQASVLDGGTPPDGVVVTSRAFETFLPQFPVVLAVAVALFAFSTLITWSYYTLKAWTSVFGRSPGSELTFKIVFCLFTVVGSVMTFESVLLFADSMLFVCAIVNLLACYILLPKVRDEMRSFLDGVKTGRIEQVPKAERSMM